MSVFEFDEAQARKIYAENDRHLISLESPAADIEDLYYRLREAVRAPVGWEILIYPLIYPSDPDGLLVTVRRPNELAGLAGSPNDWDDWIERTWGEELDVEDALATIKAIVVEANRLVDGPSPERLYNVVVRVVDLVWAKDDRSAIGALQERLDHAGFELVGDGDDAFVSEPVESRGWDGTRRVEPKEES